MSVPTYGEEFTKLIEALRRAQEAAAMIAHLENQGNKGNSIARGWLAVSEFMKKIQYQVTQLATRKIN